MARETFEGGGKNYKEEILDFAERNDLELRVMDAMGIKPDHPDSQTEWAEKYADRFMKASMQPEIIRIVKGEDAEGMAEAVLKVVEILTNYKEK